MKTKILFLLGIYWLFSVSALNAQDKLFKTSDFQNRDLYPESMSNLAWRGGSELFTYVKNNALIQKAASDPTQTDTILKVSDLNVKLLALGSDELKRFPGITWLDEQRFYFMNNNAIFSFNLADSGLIKVNGWDEKADNLNIDGRNLSVAYTIDNNLFVGFNGQKMQVSNETGNNILYGHVPSRNEFGINQGSFWSPDGKLLAFYRTDQSEVADYPLVDIFNPIAKSSPIKYPMAGSKSQKVMLGIFNPALNEITYLKISGSENQYLTSVTWGPNSNFIYAGVLNREQNHLKLNKYDAKTGEWVKTLFEETNERYVEPLHDLYFLKNNPEQFVWQSRRDGWNHLYLYNTEGELIKQLTKGEWEVTDLLGFDPEGKKVFFEATEVSPLEIHLYEADIKKEQIRRITSVEGVHNIDASARMNYFIDVISSVKTARGYYLLDNQGKNLATLLEDANPWEGYKTGEMEFITLKSDDHTTDLYARLIKPADFDPSVKYPAIVYVYGGPHDQLVDKSWTGGAGFWLNYLAQQGYVVFTLDNRGSANRGFEFESIIHRQCGEKEMADQIAGVNYLKSLSFVDSTRIGVDGWSYGGFMTISMFLRHPGVFKAACAGGPVIDWKWYEVMYGERYMDTPIENPEGYKKACLLNYVDQMEGDLMVIHGTNDPVVVWQNSLTFLDECIKKGKQVDYFVYPGAEHNMRGAARVHLFDKISGFFEDNLK